MSKYFLSKSSLFFAIFFGLFEPALATRDLLISNPATKSILRFDGTTGAPKGTFIIEGISGLITPQQIAIGPDSNIYVADFNANTVKRYSGLNGSFLGNFTPAGNLTNPIAIKFFDDGVQGMKLFVLGGGTQRQIRRYNYVSGSDPNDGLFESIVVNATLSQISIARDFLIMEGSHDYLVIGSNNKGVRYSYTAGAVNPSYAINSTGSTTILNSPRNIIYGPDGNIWISSSSGNKITRFNPSTGAKIDDIISGSPLASGPFQMQIEGTTLYVANGTANNVIRYALQPSPAGLATVQSQLDDNKAAFQNKPLTKKQIKKLKKQRQQLKMSALAASMTITPSAGQVFIAAGSQGLSGAQFMLFVDINDPPVANAGPDISVAKGDVFTLDATNSYDPEGAPISFQWTQLSGPTPLPAPTPAPSPSPSPAPAAGIPSGASPVLNLKVPYFPDAAGPMVFQISVSDGVSTRSDIINVNILNFLDADSDGMPDAWESANGLNPALNDANADLDGDGQRNYSEFLAGTNPNLNSSSLRVLEYAVVSNGFSLRFTSVYGRHYEIQSSTDLVSWFVVPGLEEIVANDIETTVVDTRPMVARRFYRIGVKSVGF